MDMNKAKPGLHLAGWWWKKVLTRPLCKIPFISKRGKFYWRELRLKRTEHPFSSKMPLMFGSNWFILNKKTISQLLAMNLQQHQLVKFYDEVERAENRHMSPDESILQCLLTDETKFKIDRNYLRFIDWQDLVEWHPNILTEKHWEAIQNSDALFARKFSFPSSNKVLDLIDTYNN
jgi:hypothetical protein